MVVGVVVESTVVAPQVLAALEAVEMAALLELQILAAVAVDAIMEEQAALVVLEL